MNLCMEICILVKYIMAVLLLQGDCWICMELMDISLDQFYKFVYRKLKDKIPEPMLGKISITVSELLHSVLCNYIST